MPRDSKCVGHLLPWLVERVTLNLQVVGSNPTLSVEIT